jgi:hypothetical protein
MARTQTHGSNEDREIPYREPDYAMTPGEQGVFLLATGPEIRHNGCRKSFADLTWRVIHESD